MSGLRDTEKGNTTNANTGINATLEFPLGPYNINPLMTVLHGHWKSCYLKRKTLVLPVIITPCIIIYLILFIEREKIDIYRI